MNTQTVPQVQPRRLGRSIIALLSGFVVGIILSIGTDLLLHAIGIVPALNTRWSNQSLALATAYRALYDVISSYVVARLAPNRPMGHALVGGAVGLLIAALGVIADWNGHLGPRGYPVALVLITMPTAWIGGKLRLMQLQPETTAS